MTRSRSRSRDRDRRRTRSRSRDKRRSRSPDRGRDRSRGSNWDAQGGSSADVVAMQAMLAMQQQQAMQRQLMAQQQALAAAAVMATQVPSGDLALDALPTQTNKKQRELYIGNLAVGIVTPEMLRELFNSMLSAMVPDPITQPPVLDVRGDPSGTGRFAFVEFRTAGLAIAALQLDKVELAGRAINIGRPKGYIEPPSLNQQAKLSAAVQFAAQMSGGPTNVVLLDNLMPAALMRDEEEKRELYDDIFMEASKCGTVIGMAVPVPPPGIPDSESARVFIKFTTQEASTKCKAMMDGREFDDRKVKASYSSDDAYYRSQANEWVSTAPVPGAYVPMQNLPSIPTGFP